jgi:hypothetical protein
VKALGIAKAELFDAPRTGTQPTRREEKVFATLDELTAWHRRTVEPMSNLRVFTYRDEQGGELFAVVRIDNTAGKRFVQYVRKARGWTTGAPTGKRPLYRLRELLAANAADPVVVVEGEAKAELVSELGLVAVTSAQGARSAKATDWTALRGRHVVALPDNDAAGREYVDEVHRLCGAASFEVLELDGLAPGEDVIDWANRRSRDEASEALRARVFNATLRETREEKGPAEPWWDGVSSTEAHTQPALQWIAYGLLPRVGVAVIAADPGSGKSFVALDLAMRVSCGSPTFLGHELEAHGPVAYMALEGREGLFARARAWKAGFSDREAHRCELVKWKGDALLSQPGRDLFASSLRRFRERSAGLALVIIDTLALAVEADENDNSATGGMLRFVQGLADELRCCILLVHHTRKGDGGRARGSMALQDVRGAGSLIGNVDCVLGVHREGDHRALLSLKSKDGHQPPPTWFRLVSVQTGAQDDRGRQESSCIVSLCQAPDSLQGDPETQRELREERKRQRTQARADDLREQVLAKARGILREHPGGLSKSALAVRIGGRRESVWSILDEACGKRDLVPTRSGGSWVLTLPGVPGVPGVPFGTEGTGGTAVPGVPVPGGCGGDTHTHTIGNRGDA